MVALDIADSEAERIMEVKTIYRTFNNFAQAPLYIGYYSENIVTGIHIDLAAVLPDGWTAAMILRRASDTLRYPAVSIMDGKILKVTFTTADTQNEGRGEATIKLIGPNGEDKKSDTAQTIVLHALDADGPAPEPLEEWLNHAALVLQTLEDKISDISGATATAESIDPDLPADVDFDADVWEFKFKIPRGEDGAQGTPGTPGADGEDGEDGITPTIGNNGNWYLGSTDTGKPSRGEQGIQGIQGEQGPQGIQGIQGPAGADGADGAGVATGGTVGQFLRKKSAADYDTEWSDVDAGNISYDGTESYADGTVGSQIESLETDVSNKISSSSQAAKTADMTQPVGIDADGKLFVPPASNIIDDTAGDGDTDKTWSADKLVEELDDKVNTADTITNAQIDALFN